MDFGKLRTIGRLIKSRSFALVTVNDNGADTCVQLDTSLERALLLAISTRKLAAHQIEKLTEMATDQGELHTLEALSKTLEKLELEDGR